MEEKKEDKKHEIDWEAFDEEKKHLFVFGRDIANIPCFRNSFLYGIGSGIGLGMGAFMITSRPAKSTHIGFSTFMLTTLGYWFYCRYNYSKTKFVYTQLKSAMRDQAVFEGSYVEDELRNKTKDA